MSSDEQDAFTGWRKVLCYIQRAGVRKAVKARSCGGGWRCGRHAIGIAGPALTRTASRVGI